LKLIGDKFAHEFMSSFDNMDKIEVVRKTKHNTIQEFDSSVVNILNDGTQNPIEIVRVRRPVNVLVKRRRNI
ncbi:MAG: hypothetical protein ACRCXT_07095, partial [Paraclostridium sp.]